MQVVTPEDLPFQKEYYEWQYKLMRKYRKELPKEFQESEAKKAENASTSGWQPAPRVTEADHSNDTKSLERKLDRRLFLLLKRKGAERLQTPPPYTPPPASSHFCAIPAMVMDWHLDSTDLDKGGAYLYQDLSQC